MPSVVALARWIPGKLNAGCGSAAASGWVNCDHTLHAGVNVCGDLRGRLPLGTDTVRAIAAIRVLQDLHWWDIAPTLAAFRRSRVPGLAALDNRMRERFFVEGVKPGGPVAAT